MESVSMTSGGASRNSFRIERFPTALSTAFLYQPLAARSPLVL
jgi:hypothetical protein